jgi:hypothetical protein
MLTTKTLLGHSHDVSCLGLCTKLTCSLRFLSSELFHSRCQEILQSKLIWRSGKLLPLAKSWGCCNQAADTSPQGRAGALFPGWNVISWMSLQIVGINNPPVLKTDTQETENLDKSIFPWSRGHKHVLTPTKRHTSTKWLTVAPPYIPDAVIPAPHLGFVQVKVSQSPLIG